MRQCQVLAIIDAVDSPFYDFFHTQKAYFQPRITLDEVCRKLDLTKADVLTYIKYKHGFNSFNSMVHWYRIAEAIDIWRVDLDAPIKEVASAVGYRFSVVFLYWLMRLKRQF